MIETTANRVEGVKRLTAEAPEGSIALAPPTGSLRTAPWRWATDGVARSANTETGVAVVECVASEGRGKAPRGSCTAKAIQSHLVLLSVCQTCKYLGADFLRSGETDVHAFAEKSRRWRPARRSTAPAMFPADPTTHAIDSSARTVAEVNLGPAQVSSPLDDAAQ